MQHGWAVIAVALAYFGLLFALAAYGDRKRPAWMTGWGRPYIYSFSIAVWCTSWTFFGSVGLAASSGLDFLMIYVGPILAFTLASPLMIKVARLAKAQNITSVADFIAARYGKNQSLAMIVSIAAVVGAVPYIALQLKAISVSVLTVFESYGSMFSPDAIAFIAALALAIFAGLFGTRHVEATEHQSGLMLAIAAESVVKLVAFLAVGIAITWFMFGGVGDLVQQAEQVELMGPFEQMPRLSTWVTFTVLSFACAFLLPRQFHVAIVENMGEREIRHASWLVPLYLIAINIFVIPLALAGMLMFADGPVPPDQYVLQLPISMRSQFFTMVAFVGGLSAATAMVIVESVALSIMVSNNIAVPLLLQSREGGLRDMPGFVVMVRRLSILAILMLAYMYYRGASASGLAQIGLLSFAAISQFAPAFFGGLIWRRGSGRGAMLGILIGLAVWTYTLLLPSVANEGLASAQVLNEGLLGLDWLKPTELFGLQIASPLVHGVFWSLTLNVVGYVLGSLMSLPSPMERMQANAFVGPDTNIMAPVAVGEWQMPVRVGELESAVARYLGEQRAREAFEEFAAARNLSPSVFDEADTHLLRYAEHLLASVIGTSSARLVLSLLLRGGAVSKQSALRLLDEASSAVQHSRDILQNALDHARHGVAVYDGDMRLVCWNREFVRIFDHPDKLLRVGKPLDEILRSNAERGIYGPGRVEDIVAERMQVTSQRRTFRSTLLHSNRVVEIRIDGMPDGGFVSTFTDVTETVEAEKALEARVAERTRELTHLNLELSRAKAEADSANYSKTRFLAAASHDILQPLNAARLYVASLSEKAADPYADLVSNVDASLQSVEEIFSVLLDISRLDAGAMPPEISSFPLKDVLRQLEVEFLPLAREVKLDLRILETNRWVRSDRRLLRRLLQNLISNAIKYTPQGRVLVGVRRTPDMRLSIQVWDTGLGIPESSHRTVFREFQRLDPGARVARGLGLGLSIVERIARVLDHKLSLRSKPGKGSVFTVEVPVTRASPVNVETTKTNPPQRPTLVSGTHVLCIDNEPAILDGMTQLLSGWDCGVMTASGLGDALAAVKSEGRPDIILADYHLDSSNGLAVIRELRQQLGADIPAVLITADHSQMVREGARALGVEVLHKPLRPAALRALMAQLRAARPAAE